MVSRLRGKLDAQRHRMRWAVWTAGAPSRFPPPSPESLPHAARRPAPATPAAGVADEAAAVDGVGGGCRR